MIVDRPENVVAFIDGANMYATAKNLRFDLDWHKLGAFMFKGKNLIRSYYYSAIRTEDDGTIRIQPLLDWLEYNGYTVVSKESKEFRDTISGKPKTKGNMDVELALDAYDAALTGKVQTIYIFSGDGDFAVVAERIQRLMVKVVVVSTIQTSPQMIADELRRQADEFIDLGDITKQLARFRE